LPLKTKTGEFWAARGQEKGLFMYLSNEPSGAGGKLFFLAARSHFALPFGLENFESAYSAASLYISERLMR